MNTIDKEMITIFEELCKGGKKIEKNIYEIYPNPDQFLKLCTYIGENNSKEIQKLYKNKELQLFYDKDNCSISYISHELNKEIEERLNEICKGKEFNEDQLEIIKQGLQQNLDVSIYAKPEFNHYQMIQILCGLIENLDISIYADPKYDEDQMIEIREGLEQDLDVSVYAKPEFKYKQMQQIKLGLLNNLDVSIYAKPEYNENQMHEIRYGLENDIDISVYTDLKYNSDQMIEIRKGLEQGLDVYQYTDPSILAECMFFIRLGLKNNLDIDIISDKLNKQNMEIKYLILKNNIINLTKEDLIIKMNISINNNILQSTTFTLVNKITGRETNYIYKLNNYIDLSIYKFNENFYSINSNNKNIININDFNNKKHNERIISCIWCLSFIVKDISKYYNFNYEQIKIMIPCLYEGIDILKYVKPEFSVNQIYMIVLGLTSKYFKVNDLTKHVMTNHELSIFYIKNIDRVPMNYWDKDNNLYDKNNIIKISN